jgi:hypothetical protein
MTTLSKTPIVCAVCGKESEQTVIISYSETGYSDLDLRPAEMKRSTLPQWIQECPFCGYSSYSIDTAEENAKACIESQSFKNLQSNASEDGQFDRFLKASMIAENCGDNSSAAEILLWAAWTADDNGNKPAAKNYRDLSADIFLNLLSDLDDGSEEKTSTMVRSIDITRRAARWSDALTLTTDIMKFYLDPILQNIVDFEYALINVKDDKCYTVGDVLAED